MPTIDDAFIKVYSKRAATRGNAEATASPSHQPPHVPVEPSAMGSSQPIQRVDAAQSHIPAPMGRRSQSARPPSTNNAAHEFASGSGATRPATPHFEQIHVEVVGYESPGVTQYPQPIATDALSIEYARMTGALNNSLQSQPRNAPVAAATHVEPTPQRAASPLFETPNSERVPRGERTQRVDLGSSRPLATHDRPKTTAPFEAAREVPSPPKPPVKEPAQDTVSETVVAEKTHASFQPVWEVDAFGWPETVLKLDANAAKTLRDAGRSLRRASTDGLRVLSVTSLARSQGRTTVAMQLARTAAQNGLRVVLVDADTECPVLADRMCVEVSRGWIDAAGDGLPLEEVAIYAIDDRITLLPLIPWTGGAARPRDAAVVVRKAIRHLAQTHDLVIMDNTQIGGLGTLFPDAEHPMIDAALLVCDQRHPDDESRDAAVARLKRLGIRQIGIVENFVESTPSE